MKRLIPLILVVALVLSGCGAFSGGSYHHVEPYQDNSGSSDNSSTTVSNYRSLYNALVKLVESGTEKGILFVPQYEQAQLDAALLGNVIDEEITLMGDMVLWIELTA